MLRMWSGVIGWSGPVANSAHREHGVVAGPFDFWRGPSFTNLHQLESSPIIAHPANLVADSPAPPCLFVLIEERRVSMTLSPLSPLSREPSPLKWTRSHLERDLRLLHLANVAPIEEDLASSTTMASHLLVLSPPIEVSSPQGDLLLRGDESWLRQPFFFQYPQVHLLSPCLEWVASSVKNIEQILLACS